MYNKVEICGVNTSKLKLLSNEEKGASHPRQKRRRQGARKAHQRQPQAGIERDSVFRRPGENPDDLFQVGCIGLIKAVDNFDISLDVKFSTYAVPRIIGTA